MPGSRPPQPESPPPPAKVETTAAALQLLQPKAPPVTVPVPVPPIQPSLPSLALHDAAQRGDAGPPTPSGSTATAPAVSEPSAVSTAAPPVRVSSPPRAVPARQRTPSPSISPQVAAVAKIRDSDSGEKAALSDSELDTESDASEGSGSQSRGPAVAQPVGECPALDTC
jgi:hypothetical protein